MSTAVVLTLASTFNLFLTTIPQTPIPIRNLKHTSETTTAGVVRSIVGNQFILDDGTGQLIVDSGFCWDDGNQLTVGEKVTVIGEYEDYDFDSFRIIRASGEVIDIGKAKNSQSCER